jgi:methenyltetrahydrofolate cyclohydrolase
MYCDKSLREYLNDLSAKLPAPGGGSAAALNAALGTSLISMVVNFSLGKPKYAEYKNELRDILAKSENLRREFLKLVDLDVTAYQSKDTKSALDVPFSVCKLCCEAINLCQPLIKKSNINLISDVAVAAILLESAFASACFNVEINLKSLDCESLAKTIRKELARKAKIVKKIRQLMEEKVGKVIRG